MEAPVLVIWHEATLLVQAVLSKERQNSMVTHVGMPSIMENTKGGELVPYRQDKPLMGQAGKQQKNTWLAY